MTITIPGVRIGTLDSLAQPDLPDLEHGDHVTLWKGEVEGVYLYVDPWPHQLYWVARGRTVVLVVDTRIPRGTKRKEWKPPIDRIELSSEESEHRNVLYIPPGCACGIQALEAETLVYRRSDHQLLRHRLIGINCKDEMFDGLWDIKARLQTSLSDDMFPFFRDIPTVYFQPA